MVNKIRDAYSNDGEGGLLVLKGALRVAVIFFDSALLPDTTNDRHEF